MNWQPVSVLLDKNIVRRVYESRVHLLEGKHPTLQQTAAANAYARLRQQQHQLCLTTETYKILQLRPPIYASRLLAQTQPVKKGRYLRRWARRLRSFVFSREDAVILAYGSFGVELAAEKRGVEFIVTEDLGMVRNYQTHFAEIKERFDQMTANLPAPYQQAALPQVITPQTILTQW